MTSPNRAQTPPSIILPDPISAVIFDMDGTLLDTEAAHMRAFAQSSHGLGLGLSESLLLSMVGIHRDENQRMLADRFGPAFPMAQFYADGDALFEAAIETGVPLRPGADIIVEHIARAGIPMAVATSSTAPLAQQRLERAGLLRYFDVVVTRTDVGRPKPHPEPYLLAARRLGVDPAHCVAVEDSPVGVRSANAAGIATVLVPDLLPPTDQLVLACAAILPSLAALRDLLCFTPPGGADHQL